MGITGLLGVLRSIQNHSHLQRFAGQTIGVDTYGWLHRGTVACALELALDKPCTKHIEFAMHRVRMLIHFGITPYLVFDGDRLPGKASTEAARAKRREESKSRGLELYNAKKPSLAYPEFQKAVDVTPHMARQLIEELKKMNVQYIVAPYEADAQLAYLEKKGVIDGILSEDSDLLVYGARKLITKVDQYGACIEINRSDFASCRDLSLAGFTDADFRRMAILSGCDYLASINKIGLKTAHTYVRKYKNIEKILRMLQFEQKFNVPHDYLERFYEAERTFLHHRVFCPSERKMVHLTKVEGDLKGVELPFLGREVCPEIAIGVACGDLDPMTKQQFSSAQVSSSRSMPDLHRRRVVATAGDLKPSKSIDTFFKPKRQPLAELDPNSLTPSPSQRRLLNVHRDASWEARPTSLAPQPRRSIPPLPPQSPVLSAERSAFLERAAARSTFQPSKRTRLCTDTDASTSGQESRSPFFAVEPKCDTPKQPSGRLRKARRSDIEIFSDDSVGDIFQDMQGAQPSMVDTPTAPTHPRGTPEKRAIVVSKPSESSIAKVCDTPSRKTNKVQQAGDEGKVEISSSDPQGDPHDFQDLFALHTSKLASLQDTFAYQSAEVQAAALSKLSPPPETSRSTKREEPAAGERSKNTSKDPHTQEGSMPKEQKVRQSLQPTFSSQPSSRQASALRSLNRGQSAAQKVRLGLAALNPSSCPEPEQRPRTPLERLGQRALKHAPRAALGTEQVSSIPHLIADVDTVCDHADEPVRALGINTSGGQELLVANSEDEASTVSDTHHSSPVRPDVDLTKFAFTPLA